MKKLLETIKGALRREPRIWSVIHVTDIYRNSDCKCIGYLYVLQDQYGNIKQEKVRV